MAPRTRRNVWTLSEDDDTLVWYRQAVGELINNRDISDPSSWIYMAAVHGTPPGITPPPGSSQFWDQCQHQSWFFLPWHRGYLAAFEAVVAKTIADLGGPEDWALPYWDYSEDLTLNPNARLMPPAFRNQNMANGTPNWLWSRRAQVSNGDFGLDDTSVGLSALQFVSFTNTAPGASSGFGGPVTGFNPGGGDNGALESLPHNRIHVRIGQPNGFMIDPRTAALDPIFWLHHCNIDRLWELWRNRGPQFQDPTAPTWQTGVAFDMHDGDGAPFTFTCDQMLDTTQVLHGYRYDTVPVALPSAIPDPTEEETIMMAAKTPDLVGATDAPIDLNETVARGVLSVEPARSPAMMAEAVAPAQPTVYLNLENVTGTGTPADFEVFVDLPDDSVEPLRVGTLTTFGVARASDPNGPHGGNGLTQVYDITFAAQTLGLNSTSAKDIQVAFRREARGAAAEGVPLGLEAITIDADGENTVQVGRISVYFEL
jgi:tyrosinase